MFDFDFNQFDFLPRCLEKFSEINLKVIGAIGEQIKATQTYWNGIYDRHFSGFITPSWLALNYFCAVERDKMISIPPWESVRDYIELLQFNLRIAEKGFTSSLVAMNEYHIRQTSNAFSAWLNTIFDREGEDINEFMARQRELLEKVVYDYPKAIQDIKSEYGFHFEDGGYVKVAETDRFILYQVLPLDKNVKVRENCKPIIVIAAYVVGANILSFLPGENMSYVHCFANQGIPTYIRITKDIDTTPAVQVMTGEDDVLDTRFFCEEVMARHKKAVTLDGYCQGGFIAAINILSGELDGLVDALITCVAPMDGTRSKLFLEYLENLPPRFWDLDYAVKTLPNGNKVVDGKVMSWIYKLKSIEKEAPLFTLYRDMMMFERPKGQEVKINKIAAALSYWLIYDRKDRPVFSTKMLFDLFTIPMDKDGNLPVKLFGRKLNFKRLKEKGIKFLICCAEEDDIIDKESAIAPLDYIDGEVTVFPKGHAAIATSWSNPRSTCALHTCFGDQNYRGPVRYHLDLGEE